MENIDPFTVVCTWLPAGLIDYLTFLSLILICLPFALYATMLHLILNTKFENDVVNEEVHRMTWAAGVVRRCLVIMAIVALPLPVSV